jgi:ABC-type sugar transport system ATPase subunit
MARGIGLLPESRHLEGLVLKHSVGQNMALPILEELSIAGLVDRKKLNGVVREKIRQLDIKPGEPAKIVSDLSGGNQQKVMIAKWMLTEPRILIVDEPTAGVDIRAKSEIHRLIKRLAQSGVAVIMISSEMPELLAHSDRIMIMNRGRILGIFEGATQEMIMSLIMDDMMRNAKSTEHAKDH